MAEMTIEVAKQRLLNTAWLGTDEDRETTEEAVRVLIKALEQEPKTRQFAEWVATEIFDENWEYNKDAFEELACRKLAKLGIVRAEGDEWVLVEPKESEG